ncbi:MAG: exo-alpha-sialidase, partial [Rhizobiales bacterium]|nr:exo-alpha-sialidase [Hyphomicrobiales bacterium]
SSKTVRVAVSCGGVWTTHDGGATWEQNAHGMRFDQGPDEEAGNPHTQDPHMMVQCRGKPDRYWVQHHCGIWKSADNAKSWQEVKAKPSSFGFGVVVHPKDPDTAWFVPGIKDEKRYPVDGKLVVTRTRDGGKTFKVLNKGLPQKHSYDLVFRHGLTLDKTGTRLAFGSTTGNLWVSENQGDSWKTVSTTLPPVHAVRFM